MEGGVAARRSRARRACYGTSCIRLGKNTSLLSRAAVRVRDDFLVGIAARVLISRDFRGYGSLRFAHHGRAPKCEGVLLGPRVTGETIVTGRGGLQRGGG